MFAEHFYCISDRLSSSTWLEYLQQVLNAVQLEADVGPNQPSSQETKTLSGVENRITPAQQVVKSDSKSFFCAIAVHTHASGQSRQ